MTDPPNPGGWPDPQRPGVPENPEQVRDHWLLWVGLFPGDKGEEMPRAYRWERDGWWDGSMHRAARYWKEGWRYLGPCLLPAEVAARVAEARAEGMREAAGIATARLEYEGSDLPAIQALGYVSEFNRNRERKAIAAAMLAATEPPRHD